jgi:hypothetical protein
MLTGASLRNNPALAHAQGEQPLAKCVVDFVGTCMK